MACRGLFLVVGKSAGGLVISGGLLAALCSYFQAAHPLGPLVAQNQSFAFGLQSALRILIGFQGSKKLTRGKQTGAQTHKTYFRITSKSVTDMQKHNNLMKKRKLIKTYIFSVC